MLLDKRKTAGDNGTVEGGERPMTVFAVDDEPLALRTLCDAITEAKPEAVVREFDRASDVLAAAEAGETPDALFTDAELSGMSGVELGRQMKLRYPRINIVFVTGCLDYMGEAFALHASGYLSKPVTAADIRAELDDLRYPVAPPAKRVRFRTFGNFEVFIDGSPVNFSRERTKEYLAYLVDRGTLCTGAEIAAALWENSVSPAYIRKLRKDLFDRFRAAGCEDVLIHKWNQQGIRTELVDCDYYDWQKGLPQGLSAYCGEYMRQYSWAELTHGALEV